MDFHAQKPKEVLTVVENLLFSRKNQMILENKQRNVEKLREINGFCTILMLLLSFDT